MVYTVQSFKLTTSKKSTRINYLVVPILHKKDVPRDTLCPREGSELPAAFHHYAWAHQEHDRPGQAIMWWPNHVVDL